jgi:EAL domain-containing protein (putative c-di-GMP-specific phosphodiesterase class I)
VVTEQVEDFRKHLDHFRPSVVMIDLIMPGIDGIELLRELAGRGCKANILVASGIDIRTLNVARNLGRELGLEIAGVIPKPVRLAELRTMLEAVKEKVSLAAAQELESAVPITKEALAEAIRGDQLFLAYQPKMSFKSGRIVSAEALVRWSVPGGDILYPDAFIPLIEKWDLSDALAAWVLDHAVEQAGVWHKGGAHLDIAVNMSALNMHDLALPDRIASICDTWGLSTSAVTLELTETATMQDAARMMDVLTRFRLKGFKLSIDDFGTGYSSLVQLQRLPFSEIKIDKSFVMSMHESPDAAVIVQAITDLGHNLGLTVVAEGVESAAALDMLVGKNCDIAQGYFISRPFAGAALPDFAARWSFPAATPALSWGIPR